ncbi:EAL domain-containing protein [Acidocella sp.]|uniref:EAL domain-containing protein n=1 Tax=Acidocella sp. TaxID=50710 RepID=UPI0026340398|nr:EAL domain-containing protein [Acidocella sp.]
MARPDAADPAYGPASAALLASFAPWLSQAAERFGPTVKALLADHDQTAAIMSYITPPERAGLQARQIHYLSAIFDPALSRAAHEQAARTVGRVHMLIGVQEVWLIQLYNAYQDHLHTQVLEAAGDPVQIHRLMRILDQRLMFDLECQVRGIKLLEAKTITVFSTIFDKIRKATSLHDLYGGVIAELARLDGILAVFVARLDEQGRFEAEESAGPQAEPYLSAMASGVVPRIRVTPSDPTPGPAAKAWLSGEFASIASYRLDPSLAPWQNFGATLGFRASASMPLVNEDGETFALVNLYSGWVGFFESSVRQVMFTQIQQALSAAALRHRQHQLIPVRTKLFYLDHLAAGDVVLEYQPIIDLKTGHAAKFEALARLRGEEGRLIAPGQFLGALGNNELLRLFALGLETICADLRAERFGGQVYAEPAPVVSLNMPPQGLTDLRYQKTLFQTLRQTGIPGRRIELELLETSDLPQTANPLFVLNSLRAAGIALIQDDLGSGHSSLLRMGSLRFDGVKIEQGLVRGALARRPWHVLEFIYHLTNLAHSLGVPVTVEGLENQGLIEAAVILGADYGQGFGIARPMAARHLAPWRQGFCWTIERTRPETELGLLSAYLLWDMRLKAFPKNEPPAREFLDQTCPLQGYLARQPRPRARSGALRAAVHAHHQAAARDIQSRAYASSQAQIIELLSAQWSEHAA